MLATAIVSLSLGQVVASFAIIFAFMALALLVGIAEGRAREACESTQKLAEDHGKGLGAKVRGRHP